MSDYFSIFCFVFALIDPDKVFAANIIDFKKWDISLIKEYISLIFT